MADSLSRECEVACPLPTIVARRAISSVCHLGGWDPKITLHDRRRILARELVSAKLGVEFEEVCG